MMDLQSPSAVAHGLVMEVWNETSWRLAQPILETPRWGSPLRPHRHSDYADSRRSGPSRGRCSARYGSISR